LSGAASTVEEREKLAQAHVTGTHNGIDEVALPSETAAGVAELSGAASTVEEREKPAHSQVHTTGSPRWPCPPRLMPRRLKVVVMAMLDMATMVHYTEAAL